MAIVNIASTKQEAEAKQGMNIRLYDSSDHENELWLYDTHVGLCVAEREANHYDDSDFYMTVYIPETNSFKEIEFATTRAWSYPCLASKVDAPPEIMEKYKQHLEQIKKEQQIAFEAMKAKDPTVGKTVRVTEGRKYRDKTGKIFWRGVNSFRPYYRNGYNRPEALYNQRIGIEDEKTGEKFFVSADQVMVILE